MKTVFITGVNRGIGHELASQFVQNEYKVIGTVRNKDAQQHAPVGVKTLVADITDMSKIQHEIDNLGVVDILIQNAGIIGASDQNQTTLNVDVEAALETFHVNTIAPLLVVKSLMNNLRLSHDPKILIISSMMARFETAKSDRIIYRASKTALNKCVQGLATDLREYDIPVIAVDPGWVKTDMGGSDAEITVQTCANGILKLTDSINIQDTGLFFNYDGTRRSY